MADILRGPLYVARRELAPVLAVTAFALPSLLVTLLALPLPVGGSTLPAQILQPPAINADTSHGTPKTLTEDRQAPFFVTPHTAPGATRIKNWLPADTSSRRSPIYAREEGVKPFFVASHLGPSATRVKGWLPADTSRSSAKTLFFDAQAPTFVPPGFAPSATRIAGWLPTDTTQDQPLVLRDVVAPPVVPAPLLSAPGYGWQGGDTTQDQPLTLRDVVVVPVGVAPPALLPRYPGQTGDTSQDTPLTLLSVVALPPGQAAAVGVAQVLRLLPDGSSGTPKALVADAQLPFAAVLPVARERGRDTVDTTRGMPLGLRDVVAAAPVVPAPHYAPQRAAWQPADSTSKTPETLIADAQAPFAIPPWPAPERPRFSPDTSQDVPTPLLPVAAAALPVGASAPTLLHRVLWRPADTSSGTPKPLVADAQAPVANLAYTPPDRVRAVAVESSRGTPKPLYGDGIAAFTPPPHFAPLRFWFQPEDTSSGTPKALIADAQAPFANLAQTAPDRVRPVTDASQSAYATSQAVVIIPLPPGQAAYVAPPRMPWSNGDTTAESPPVAIQGVAPAPTPPVVPDVSTSPQGRYDEALADKVRAWWDAEEARKREKPGFPETKKKRPQPLPDATAEAKPKAKPADVTLAERVLDGLTPKIVVRDPGVVLSDDEIAQLLLLLDDDDDET